MTSGHTRRTILAGGAALLAPAFGCAAASPWPDKPVRMLCGLAPGGLADLVARAYCNELQTTLHQTFVVENKAGAGSILACQEIARAAPDGYNLLYTIGTALVQNPVLYSKLPYNPAKDFTPLAFFEGNGMPLCVNPNVPAKTLPEFISWAKDKPVNLGTYAAGSLPHMLVTLLNKRYGLKIEAVHYKGESPMWQDVAGGSLHAGMGSYASVVPRLQAASVRPIGIMGRVRLTRLPDVPTFAEQGVSDRQFSLSTFHAMLGPAGMSPELRNRISGLLVEAGKKESVHRVISTAGSDMQAAGWQTYDQYMKEEAPIVQGILREIGVRLD